SLTTAAGLSVTVSLSGGPGAPVATGTVVLTAGSYTSSAATLSAGKVSIQIPAGTLTAGSYTFQASYTPDTASSGIYSGATGTASSAVTVTTATPVVSVTPGSSSLTATQPLTVTVGVSDGTGSPAATGTVTLTGGSYTSSASTLSLGKVSIQIPAGTLKAGSYTFQASYTPDTASSGIYSGATGTASSAVTVTTAMPAVSVAPGSSSLTTAQPLTVTVGVSGGTGSPTATGTVTLTLTGGSYSSSAARLSGGHATFTIPVNSLAVGTDTLMASYTPDATSLAIYNSSTGTATVTALSPLPVINSLSPAFVSAGSATFTLTLSGWGFVTSSTVYWGTIALPTQFVSPTKLTAQVMTSNIPAAGTTPITVQTPTPGGGTSNAQTFEIDSASSGITPPMFVNVTAIVFPGASASYSVVLPSAATDISVMCLNLPRGASCGYSSIVGVVTIITASSTPPGTYQITVVFTETVSRTASAWILVPFLLLPILRVRSKRTAIVRIWSLI
ncbi:MAG: Ig-like domain repeat protein, partial [Terracidiphilus sp.]